MAEELKVYSGEFMDLMQKALETMRLGEVASHPRRMGHAFWLRRLAIYFTYESGEDRDEFLSRLGELVRNGQ